MKIKGRGNAIAIALAGLAVVLAASGTAYAVTASAINIADPTTPAQIARVDNTGHLNTVQSVSTISSAGYLVNYTTNSWNYVTSPTTSYLAITRVRLENPARNGTNNEQIALYKVGVDASGKCAPGGQTLYGYYDLAAGQESTDPFPSAMLVRPTGTAKYCLAFYIVSTDPDQAFYATYSLEAYVHTGGYAGVGTAASPARINGSPKIVR